MASLPASTRSRPTFRRAVAIGLSTALWLAGPGGLPLRPALAQPAPQAVATAGTEAALGQPQLEQLLAPIALYPDDLLTQMLMAATYPMEVVQAQRWLTRGTNASLRGDALVKALEAQAWDPSVKSLVPFPEVLAMMNDQLEWTQLLGDAVLAQQADVFNAIQVLRNRARDAGKLESGAQQTVNVTQSVTVAPPAGGGGAVPAAVVAPPPQIITIAPTQPDTVFVPAYDPSVVYGTWPYPSYPPPYYPPPVGLGLGNALLTGMAFAGGAAVVGSLWGWARPAWGRGNVDLDVNRVNNINVNRNQISGNNWSHDVTHRQGVAYRNEDVRNRYQGNRPDRSAAARDEFRGRTGGDRPAGGLGDRGPGGGLGDRGPGGRLGDREPGGGLGDRGPGGGLGDRGPGGGLGDRGPGGGLGDRGPGGGLGDRGPGGGLGDRRPGGGPGDRGPGGGLGDRAPGAGLGDRAPGGGPGNALADRGPGAATRPAGGSGPGATTRPAGGSGPGASARPGGGGSPGTATRPAGAVAGHAPSGRPTPAPQPAARPAGGGGPQSLQGLGQGGDVRAAAQRGQASRQTPVSRPAPSPAIAGGNRPSPGSFAGGGNRPSPGAYSGGGNRPSPGGFSGGGGGGGGRAAAAGGGGRRGR